MKMQRHNKVIEAGSWWSVYRLKPGLVICLFIAVVLGNNPALAKRTIYGTITDMTGAPAAGMLVKAWDSDDGADDFMGQAYTDANGRYKIGPFTAKHWDPAPHNVTTWRPDIYIQVYAKIKGNWVKVKQSGVYNDRKHKNDTTINLKLTGISGVISDARRPVAGILVRAWDSDDITGGKHDFLNEAKTDSQGRYFMLYEGKHWDPAPHNVTTWRPDIFIKVLRNVSNYGWVRVNQSKVYSDWPHRNHLTINLTIPEDRWVGKMTRFSPRVNGWPFRNEKRKICAAPTCKEEHLGNSALREVVRFDWALCGGMSLSALRRFRDGKPVQDFSPSVKKELVDAQLDTLFRSSPTPGAWSRFVKWTMKPDQPHTVALHTIGQSTKEEWPKLRRAIDGGSPIIMGLIRSGPSNVAEDVSSNHQVLAIGYKYNDGTKEVKIYAYDPNYPGKTSEITMNIGIPGNQLKARQSTPGFCRQKNTRGGTTYYTCEYSDTCTNQAGECSLDDKLRGFFVISLDSGRPGPRINVVPMQRQQPVRPQLPMPR